MNKTQLISVWFGITAIVFLVWEAFEYPEALREVRWWGVLAVVLAIGVLNVSLREKKPKELRKQSLDLERAFRAIVFVLSSVGAFLGIWLLTGLTNEHIPRGTGDLVVVISLAGIGVAGAAGFAAVWLVYYLIRWFVLGFVADKPKDEQKQ
jgi:hypothetical protein